MLVLTLLKIFGGFLHMGLIEPDSFHFKSLMVLILAHLF
jgi:hypothetical protein